MVEFILNTSSYQVCFEQILNGKPTLTQPTIGAKLRLKYKTFHFATMLNFHFILKFKLTMIITHLVEPKFGHGTSKCVIMLNFHFVQKFKLIERVEFIYLNKCY